MENSDTGTELVIESEDNQQPAEIVADKVEDKEGSLQPTDNVEFELQIDDEGKPDKEPEKQPDYELARKAYQERKEKRERKQREEAERKAMEERLAKLEAERERQSLGPVPTLESCDYDETAYQHKLQEYYTKANAIKQPKAESEQKPEQKGQVQLSTDAMIATDKQEEGVRSKYKKYDLDKVELEEKFANDNINADGAMTYLQQVCHADGTDFAKVVIGLTKIPNAYEKLKEIDTQGPVAAARYLRQVAGKVKLAEAKKIDTKPEPEINSSGPIDNANASVEKLRQKWKENPTTGNYRAYQQAKAQLKGK